MYMRQAMPGLGWAPRSLPIRRRRPARRGVGDAASCGTNPCTWFDDVYLRDDCMAYLTCADPNNALLTIVNKGLVVGGAQVAGQTAGQAVQSAVTGAFVNPLDSSVNWPMIAVAGLGGLLLLEYFMPARGRR